MTIIFLITSQIIVIFRRPRPFVLVPCEREAVHSATQRVLMRFCPYIIYFRRLPIITIIIVTVLKGESI